MQATGYLDPFRRPYVSGRYRASISWIEHTVTLAFAAE
jgi:hypothetical protein